VRRPILLLATCSALAGLVAAPVTAARPTASAFMKRVVRQIVSNDYEHAWLSLHPAQQQLVPQEDYVRCENKTPVPGRLVWIKVVRVADARFAVGGVTGRVAGKAVTLRLKLADDTTGSTVVVTHTAHAVWVGGRWRWILPAERIGLYTSSACTTEGSGP
jgi:hypothetical protein